MLTRLTVGIVSQYILMSSHYVVCMKLIQCQLHLNLKRNRDLQITHLQITHWFSSSSTIWHWVPPSSHAYGCDDRPKWAGVLTNLTYVPQLKISSNDPNTNNQLFKTMYKTIREIETLTADFMMLRNLLPISFDVIMVLWLFFF